MLGWQVPRALQKASHCLEAIFVISAAIKQRILSKHHMAS